MLICWSEVRATQRHKTEVIYDACIQISVDFSELGVLQVPQRRWCLTKTHEQPFLKHQPSSRSFTDRGACGFRGKWRAEQIALTLPESSPSQTCFWTPHCASLLSDTESFQEHWAGCPTFFFLSIYHTDFLISAHTHTHFPPDRFPSTSNGAYPVLSCLLIRFALWSRVWLPSGFGLFLRSAELWWNRADSCVVQQHRSQPAFLMCHFTYNHRKNETVGAASQAQAPSAPAVITPINHPPKLKYYLSFLTKI